MTRDFPERMAEVIAKLEREPTPDYTLGWYACRAVGFGVAAAKVSGLVPASADAKVFKDEALRVLKEQGARLAREMEDAMRTMAGRDGDAGVFLDVMREVRQKLVAAGVQIDTAAWLAGDEEP